MLFVALFFSYAVLRAERPDLAAGRPRAAPEGAPVPEHARPSRVERRPPPRHAPRIGRRDPASFRRALLATMALGGALPRAAARGLDPALAGRIPHRQYGVIRVDLLRPHRLPRAARPRGSRRAGRPPARRVLGAPRLGPLERGARLGHVLAFRRRRLGRHVRRRLSALSSEEEEKEKRRFL